MLSCIGQPRNTTFCPTCNNLHFARKQITFPYLSSDFDRSVQNITPGGTKMQTSGLGQSVVWTNNCVFRTFFVFKRHIMIRCFRNAVVFVYPLLPVAVDMLYWRYVLYIPANIQTTEKRKDANDNLNTTLSVCNQLHVSALYCMDIVRPKRET
jgi:hypothetical protein